MRLPTLGFILLSLAVSPLDIAAQSRGDVVRPRWQLVVGGPEVEDTRCGTDMPEPPTSCGTVTVDEDRSKEDARRIKLGFTVLRALERGRGEDQPPPIFVLSGRTKSGIGSPGLGVTHRAKLFGREFENLRRTRDLVLIDPRGTGQSNPLRCRSQFNQTEGRQLGPVFTAQEISTCFADLRNKAEIGHYSTSHAVQDLEDMRIALGYGRIDLLGISFGSRLALEYVRQYPRHVGRVVLMGTAPLGTPFPMQSVAGYPKTLEQIGRLCASDPACNKTYWRFERDLKTIDRRFADPVEVEWTSDDGTTRSGWLDRDRVHALLALRLSTTAGIEDAPATVRDLAKGRIAAFAEASRITLNRWKRNLAAGQALEILCTEDLPFIDAEHRAAPSDSPLGRGVVDQIDALCSARGSTDPLDTTATIDARPEPVSVANPVLILVGSLDPITPPPVAQEVASHLPNGVLVEIPNAGHDLFEPCSTSLAHDFFTEIEGDPTRAGCLQESEPPQFTVRHRTGLWARILRLFARR